MNAVTFVVPFIRKKHRDSSQSRDGGGRVQEKCQMRGLRVASWHPHVTTCTELCQPGGPGALVSTWEHCLANRGP